MTVNLKTLEIGDILILKNERMALVLKIEFRQENEDDDCPYVITTEMIDDQHQDVDTYTEDGFFWSDKCNSDWNIVEVKKAKAEKVKPKIKYNFLLGDNFLYISKVKEMETHKEVVARQVFRKSIIECVAFDEESFSIWFSDTNRIEFTLEEILHGADDTHYIRSFFDLYNKFTFWLEHGLRR